jgi:hypothetical protein
MSLQYCFPGLPPPFGQLNNQNIIIIVLQGLGLLACSGSEFIFWNLWIYWTVGRIPWTGDQPDARPLPIQDNTTQKNVDTHSCLKRDSKPRSQFSSGRRQYVPQTAWDLGPAKTLTITTKIRITRPKPELKHEKMKNCLSPKSCVTMWLIWRELPTQYVQLECTMCPCTNKYQLHQRVQSLYVSGSSDNTSKFHKQTLMTFWQPQN